MRVCILMGSPRPNGNTAELCKPFVDELLVKGADVEYITLHDKKLLPCLGCYHCQNIADEYGCAQADDMEIIIASILRADVLVFATPIYSWQATPPLKAVMDRMFGLNKFYGSVPNKALVGYLKYALIATCGYDIDYGTAPLEEAIKRGCTHGGATYLGMYAVRDVDGLADFRTIAAQDGARKFARTIFSAGL